MRRARFANCCSTLRSRLDGLSRPRRRLRSWGLRRRRTWAIPTITAGGSRRGLVFSQKAPLAGSNQAKLRAVLRAALENCRKLEAEPALRGKLRFAANEAVISVNDRLLGENSQQAFAALKGDVEAVAGQLFGGGAVSVERDEDARQRLNLHVKTAAALDVGKALANLPRD